MRITKEILEAKVERLNRTYGLDNSNAFDLEYAYGKVKVVKKVDNHGYEDVTIYGTKSEIGYTIDAIIKAYELVK